MRELGLVTLASGTSCVLASLATDSLSELVCGVFTLAVAAVTLCLGHRSGRGSVRGGSS